MNLSLEPTPTGIGVARTDRVCSSNLALPPDGYGWQVGETDTLVSCALRGGPSGTELCPQHLDLETLASCAILRSGFAILGPLAEAVHRGYQHERGITAWRPGQHGLHAAHLRGPARLALDDQVAPVLRLWAIERWLCGDVAEHRGFDLIEQYTELASAALEPTWKIGASPDRRCAYSSSAPCWALWDAAPIAIGSTFVAVHPGCPWEINLPKLARKLGGRLEGRVVHCIPPADLIYTLRSCGLPHDKR